MRTRCLLYLCLATSPVATLAQGEINLRVDPLQVTRGSNVQVTWNADWADQCLAGGLWLGRRPASGEERMRVEFVQIDESRVLSELTLTCFRGSSSVTESVTLDVIVPGAGFIEERTRFEVVEVFYGTSRAHRRLGGEDAYSDDEWARDVAYGVADVSIPLSHRPGELERPVWWKLEFSEDPDRHIVVRDLEALENEAFFTSIAARVSGAPRREVFVFVHGFNVSFEDALLRTAQLASDLRLTGVPVTYSWPSNRGGVFGYTAAENNALKTVNQFVAFIDDVRNRAGATTVNVLAHSMGNRILLDSLRAFSMRDAATLSHVVFAAPDVDVDLFESQVVDVLGASKSTTMYASAADKALALSTEVHGAPRAGSAVIVVAGMDSVDASQLDLGLLGHSYYADKLIQDMFYLFHHDFRAVHRHLLRRESQKGEYWALPAFD